MRNKIKFLTLLVTIGIIGLHADATPVLNEIWGSVTPMTAWVAVDVGFTAIPGPTPGTAGQNITLTFPFGGGAPAATISTMQGAYVGNYASVGGTDLAVKFTFDPANVVPDIGNGGLGLYFVSGLNLWNLNNVITPITTGPQTYTINIGLASNWTPAFGNVADWASAFTNITEFGFLVNGPMGVDQQLYTFSDIQLTSQTLSVPEPETVWMIMMVLASLGLTFRSRIGELAGQVKARIKA